MCGEAKRLPRKVIRNAIERDIRNESHREQLWRLNCLIPRPNLRQEKSRSNWFGGSWKFL